jgi:hypothetical protein
MDSLFSIEGTFPCLPVNLILGTPSLNCSGHGICRIFPQRVHWIANAISCPVTLARFMRNTNNGNLYLLFDRSVLTNQIIEKHFSTPFFQMEEPFRLPKFVQEHFGLPKASSILPGTYLIERNTECLRISLT